MRDPRWPCRNTANPPRERRLLYEAFQVNIRRRDKNFEKGNFIWIKFDRISAFGAIADHDYLILTEWSFFCRLWMVEILKVSVSIPLPRDKGEVYIPQFRKWMDQTQTHRGREEPERCER